MIIAIFFQRKDMRDILGAAKGVFSTVFCTILTCTQMVT